MKSKNYFTIHSQIREQIKLKECVDCRSDKNLIISSNNTSYNEDDFVVRCYSCNSKKDFKFKKEKGISPIHFFFKKIEGSLILK